MRTPKKPVSFPWEALVWSGGLVGLAFLNPTEPQVFSLCPLHAMGWDWCWGCGLGRSIAWLWRAEYTQSFNAHPLGLPAVLILGYRILTLVRNYVLSKKTKVCHAP